MINKESILTSIRENRLHLKSLGIKQLGLFGSFVRNTQHSDSDIDLLVEFDAGKKNITNLLNAHEYLESLLGRKTELITSGSLTNEFKKIISRDIEYVAL